MSSAVRWRIMSFVSCSPLALPASSPSPSPRPKPAPAPENEAERPTPSGKEAPGNWEEAGVGDTSGARMLQPSSVWCALISAESSLNASLMSRTRILRARTNTRKSAPARHRSTATNERYDITYSYALLLISDYD